MQLYTKPQKIHYQLPVLGKLLIALTLFLAVFSTVSVYSFEKHESTHQITFGSLEAKLAVTQHFCLGSPEFVRFAKEEFPGLKANFIDTGLVSWRFCPHFADIYTIQLVSRLEILTFEQKPLFFEQVLLETSPRTSGEILQILTNSF